MVKNAIDARCRALKNEVDAVARQGMKKLEPMIPAASAATLKASKMLEIFESDHHVIEHKAEVAEQWINILALEEGLKSFLPVVGFTPVRTEDAEAAASKLIPSSVLLDGNEVICLEGVIGNYASNNGVYLPTGKLHNGKELFRKEGDQDIWLGYDLHGFWAVARTHSIEENDCKAYITSSETGLGHPLLSALWKVPVEGQDGQWENQGTIRCIKIEK